MASLFLVKELQFRGYVIGTKVIALERIKY